MSELKDITYLVLESIESKLPAKSIFNLWFGNFELISLTDEKAVFFTPTNLRKNIISTRYINILTEALEDAIGFSVNIEIECPPENNTNIISVEDDDIKIDDTEDYKKESDKRKKEINMLLNDDNNPPNKSLLKDYTFDNFIEGESNKFVKAACLAVAKDPTYYNPLFIHGHSGLGKTHLLYAVINYLRENHPKLKIVYKKCEDFMNELIEAISKAETAEFKEKYRTADVLLIDDIQFIAGKVSTQEEFFHTFSSLYEADKQIILTSDRPPKDIKPLEDRLRSRFEGGLIADVLPPSFELRTAIIKKKASSMNLLISNELVDYMAERLQKNIRQIEGVLKRLYALYSLSSSPVTKESIDQAISYIDPGNIPTDALVEKILSVVSKKYGISIEDIKSKKRTENIANARHTSIYIIRSLTNLSLKEIGAIFGRDHATVLSSLGKIETNIKTKNKTAAEINEIKKEIKGI
jgi:chromosomal replication initiator protein